MFFLFIPANPFIIIVTQIFTGLAPSLGHSNFDRIVTVGDRTLPAGDYFHDLHHKYFECNYGTPVVPVDAWVGTWHDGSPEAHERMRVRREAAGHLARKGD